MKKYILSLSLLLVAGMANAAYAAAAANDNIVIDGGLGIFNTQGDTLSDVKFVKIGLQRDLWYAFKQRFNGGLWLDSRGKDYNNSAFVGYQLGFEVKNDVLIASIFVGPSLISSPDADLGGPLQFNDSLFLGIVDKFGDSIGVVLNHFSSAGLEMPNVGKNFLCLEIKFPF